MTDQVALQAIEHNKRAFQLCFQTPAGQDVLIYLSDFCRASEPCVAVPPDGGQIDLNRTLILEGRREVWLQIQKFLNLTPEQMFLLFTRRPYHIGDASDE